MTRNLESVLVRIGALAVAFALALPAAAQVDLTNFVQIGDSYTAGYQDGCWAKHGQLDDFGIILSRQAGTDANFQQPLLDEPGVGGCLVLTSLAPTFTRKASTPKPLNLTLPRPYNNLAVPGFAVNDVVNVKASAQNGNPLTDLVLRGLGGGTTALQQAASLKPSFVSVFIGGNDVLGAVLSGTAIDGVTVTKVSDFTPKYKQIVDTLKASQGGNAKGVFIGLADVDALPFATTIPPFIVVGGQPVINPATGTPFTFLSSKGGTAAPAPIPANSLVTLNASAFLATGYGIPCAILDAGGVPANSPLRMNCNKPLPDNADPKTGIPGVVLYPDEVQLVTTRVNELTAQMKMLAEGAGYTFYDIHGYFDELVAHGREIGGMTITTSFLSGGFFSYDGFHPTSTAWAIFANDLITYLNANAGANLPYADISSYLFNGNSQAGGWPIGTGARLSYDEVIDWGKEIFTPDMWAAQRALYPPVGKPELVLCDDPGELIPGAPKVERSR